MSDDTFTGWMREAAVCHRRGQALADCRRKFGLVWTWLAEQLDDPCVDEALKDDIRQLVARCSKPEFA